MLWRFLGSDIKCNRVFVLAEHTVAAVHTILLYAFKHAVNQKDKTGTIKIEQQNNPNNNSKNSFYLKYRVTITNMVRLDLDYQRAVIVLYVCVRTPMCDR